jgi:hypothetical protein
MHVGEAPAFVNRHGVCRDAAARTQGAMAPRPVERVLVRYHHERLWTVQSKRACVTDRADQQGTPGLCFGGRGSVMEGANVTVRQSRAGARSADVDGVVRNARRRTALAIPETALAAAFARSCVDPKVWRRRSRKVALLSVLCRACAPTATLSPKSCDSMTAGKARTIGAARVAAIVAPNATTGSERRG